MGVSALLRMRGGEATTVAPVVDRFDRSAQLFAVVVIAIALLTLVGWQVNITFLKSVAPWLPATQPLAAIALSAAAVGLLLLRGGHPLATGTRVTLGAGIAIFAAFAMVQNAFDVDWGTDRLWFADEVVSGQTGRFLRPGRPAGSCLVAILLLGAFLLLVRSRRPHVVRFNLIASGVGLLGATIALLGYGLNVVSLEMLGLYAAPSLPSAVMCWLLFASALIAQREHGIVAELCADDLGAISARSLVAAFGSLLVMLVAVVQFASHARWYRGDLAVFFVTVTGLLVMAYGVVSHLRRINDLEKRRQAQARLLLGQAAAAAEAYQQSRKDKADLIAILAHELRNPLQVLNMAVQIQAQRGADNPDDQLEVMRRQIRRLSAIIDSNLTRYDDTKADEG